MRIFISAVLSLALLTQPLGAQIQTKIYGSVGTETTGNSPNSDSPLNPGNVLDVEKWNNASDLTVYGNVAPDSRSWKVDFKLRDTANLQRNSTARGEIDELFFGKSIASWLDIGVGRKIERWGTGYGWNPTGVVNPPKDSADPNDRLETYRGTDMVKADILAKGWNVSLLAVPRIQWNSGAKMDAMGWAGRAYRLIGGVDVSVTASGGNGLPNSFGLSGARVIGNAFEVHAEFARISDSRLVIPVGNDFRSVPRINNSLVAGGHYTTPNGINIMFEYFHNGLGLSGNEWKAFQRLVDVGGSELQSGDPTRLLQANSYYQTLGVGRNYTFSRVSWPIRPNKLEVETISITSLRDGSTLFRPSVNFHIRPNLEVYWIHGEFLGGPNSELRYTQINRSSHFGIRYHFSFDRTK
jgi:hypothetical protein